MCGGETPAGATCVSHWRLDLEVLGSRLSEVLLDINEDALISLNERRIAVSPWLVKAAVGKKGVSSDLTKGISINARLQKQL